MPLVPMLPALVAAFVRSAPLLAVSGARCPSPLVAGLASALVAARPRGAPLLVGCAPGVDALARRHPSAQVLHASAFGRGPASFAARSCALVRRLAATPGALLAAFPGGPCPLGLLPSATPGRAFSGHGSGTWGTAALAAGVGLQLLVALPAGVPQPHGWPLYPLAQGACGLVWWRLQPAPTVAQGSLF